MSKSGKAKNRQAEKTDNVVANDNSSKIIEISSLSQFERTVFRSEKPSIVDFWAPWCNPCKMMTPIFEKLSESYGDDMNFVKVNTQMTPDVAGLFGIRSIPTMMILQGEDVRDVHVGAAPGPKIEKMINRMLKKTSNRTFIDRFKSIFIKND